ncbi:MAG: peptidyl-alpha-hydroxyglycine alpha-amidating lyase family protein [Thermodesulfobacteriota bacterium]|nr:peptidyl-alpha-hydroxyglycine alpha-amidating lyase family protein [Thermodesulfobacteriota bacterium]
MPLVPRFKVIEGWEKLPAGYVHKDVNGVAVDSQDRVYLMTRQDARVIVYDRNGNFLRSWGEDIFTPRTHGIAIGPDDMVYTVDDGDHTVRKFTPEGKQLMMIGTAGKASDTGYDGKTITSIQRSAPPFNRPTNVAVAPDGELYVSDGYGNACVHRFTADGTLIQSWGEPGIGPGQFYLPHGIGVSPDDRVFLADRENDRIQIFSRDGQLLEAWTHVQRPTDIAFGRDGLLYVSELWWRVGQSSFVHGQIKYDLPGRVSVFDLKGNVMTRWGSADRAAPGEFVAPHTLCLDSRNDLYVGEVTWTFGISRGGVPEDAHTFQKFARV